jgi:hypothetical protein
MAFSITNQLLYPAELRAQNAATLYFSVVGAASISPLHPSIARFQLLTFWPVCNESLMCLPISWRILALALAQILAQMC